MFSREELELAWAAGFFDGEGCTTNARMRGKLYTRIQVSQKERSLLDRFNAAIDGVGHIHLARQIGRCELFHCRVMRPEDVEAVMRRLWPYLSEPKREQFRRRVAEAESSRIYLGNRRRSHAIEVPA